MAITVEEAAEVDTVPEAIPLDILHEDADLIVVNKPAGMVVHPAPGTPTGTLVNALLHHFGGNLSGIGGEKRPGIVHRIDKDTSGLLVVAKSDRAHHGLAAQFADHSITREYQALCHGVPDAADPRLRGVRGCPCRAQAARCASRRSLHGTRRIDSGRQCYSRAGATRSRICGSRKASPGCWRVSPAGWRRGARIRSACTWPISATRWWAIRYTAEGGACRRRCWAPSRRR
jgi:hypothetical protein